MIEVNRTLLISYFEGNASAIQKQLIEKWLKESGSEAEELFYEVLEAWEQNNLTYASAYQEGLALHYSKLDPNALPVEKKNPWLLYAHKIAASILLLVALSTLGYIFKEKWAYQTYRTDFGEKKQLELPDGTKVYLNANSILTVPRFGFGKQDREVQLQGEAQFSVAHTPNNQRFVVHTTNRFDVIVLGTEFTVFSRKRGAKVYLINGKVSVQYPSQNQAKRAIVMHPGELLTVAEQGKVALKPKQHTNTSVAWKANRYDFEETSLAEIAQIINENFGVNVSFQSPEVTKWTVSGSFSAQNANELLELISKTANLTYTYQGNKVVWDIER